MENVNLNITSKFKKDVPKEIRSKINKIWNIDFLEVKNKGGDFYEIAYADFKEPYINTLQIKIDLKEKGKLWNLNKDFAIVELFKNYKKVGK